MTSVSAAATKTIADTSVNAVSGKASQNGGSGQFAQVLTGANSEVDADMAEAEDGSGAASSSQSGATPSTIRFSSLQDLTALTAAMGSGTAANAGGSAPALGQQLPQMQQSPQAELSQLTQVAPQTPATQQGQLTQPQPIDPKLLQASVQQASLQTVDQQIPLPTTGKSITAAVDQQTSTPADGEVAVEDASLAKLTVVLTGVKRASTAPVEAVKDKPDDTAKQDDTTADQTAANIAPVAPSDAMALSAQALLQLTAAPAAAATGALAAPAPVEPSGASAALVTEVDPGDDADNALPSDNSDISLDYLTTPDAADTTATKSFRFQKAGDAAVAVSLSITKSDDGGADLQDSLPGTTKTETITVLDSRRFLGFGLGANASNMLSAASNDRDWAAAMHPASALSNAASASSTGNVVNTLKLQLNPDNLGTVTANMRLVGDELSIHLTVHNAAAFRELNEDRKPMLEALRAQGFNVDQVTVSMAPASDTNSSNSGDQPQNSGNNQSQQQQLSRDGEAARQQAQGQGQGRPSDQSNRNNVERRNEIAVEAGSGSGSSAGDIYL